MIWEFFKKKDFASSVLGLSRKQIYIYLSTIRMFASDDIDLFYLTLIYFFYLDFDQYHTFPK